MSWAIWTIWIWFTNLGEYIYTVLKYFKVYFSILFKLERSNTPQLRNPLSNLLIWKKKQKQKPTGTDDG